MTDTTTEVTLDLLGSESAASRAVERYAAAMGLPSKDSVGWLGRCFNPLGGPGPGLAALWRLM